MINYLSRVLPLGILCGFIILFQFNVNSQTVVFSTDFETGIPSEFSGITSIEGTQGFSTYGSLGNEFSGNFLRNTSGNSGSAPAPQTPTILTLTGLPTHTSIDINFLLAVIDTWDGNAFGPSDFFNVTVDGNLIFQTQFQHAFGGPHQYIAPPGVSLIEFTPLGFTSNGPNAYDSAFDLGLDPIFDNIPHTGNTLVVEWHTNANFTGGGDESWAIDNVEIILNGVLTVPTLGQWGLIILTLLLLSFGTVAIRSQQLILAGSSSEMPISIRQLPYEKGLFGKLLLWVVLGVVAIFALSIIFFSYELTSADVPGSLVAMPLFAYLLHLLFLKEK